MNVTPCHALSRVTSRQKSRVGHAMSTAPHRTYSLRLFVLSRSLRIRNYRRAGAAMRRCAARVGGGRQDCLHDWVRRVRPDGTISSTCAKCGEKR